MPQAETAKISRRRYLEYVCAATAGLAVGVAAGRYGWSPPEPPKPPKETTRTATLTQTETEILRYPESLRAAAGTSGLLVGAAVDSEGLRDERYATILGREFNCVTPEWEMKWKPGSPC